jgi:hypothetical protein
MSYLDLAKLALATVTLSRPDRGPVCPEDDCRCKAPVNGHAATAGTVPKNNVRECEKSEISEVSRGVTTYAAEPVREKGGEAYQLVRDAEGLRPPAGVPGSRPPGWPGHRDHGPGTA